MTTLRIWRAGAEEAGVLQRLERVAFGARSWGAKGVAESFDAPGAEVLFAGTNATEPDGFAIWRMLPGEAEMLAIGVAPASRGAGVGRALLEEAMGRASRSGAAAMLLEVDAGNAPALGLYASTGFKQVGLRKSYYRDGADAQILRRSL